MSSRRSPRVHSARLKAIDFLLARKQFSDANWNHPTGITSSALAATCWASEREAQSTRRKLRPEAGE